MTPAEYIQSYRERLLSAVSTIPADSLAQAIAVLENARGLGARIFICGNGGSAATSSHFAEDLGKGASEGRVERFRVSSLTDNAPWITALANDTDYSRVFIDQLQNYAEAGDVLIAFSGSGDSPNIIRAVQWANENNLITIGFTGRPGGRLAKIVDFPIFAEASHMGVIEDVHCAMMHAICYWFIQGGQ